jgi:RNA polymerase sigma-70 factor, ECF subfamily
MPESVLAFDDIDAAYRSRILRYLTRMVGELEAQDLTQEVLLKISTNLKSFRGESRLSTWIYRIATNAALDRLRDPSRRRVISYDTPDDPDLDPRELGRVDLGTDTAMLSPEQQACRQERYDCYCRLIQDLPAGYRAVVALSSLEDLAAAEIAEILGLNLSTVKIRLHRGRARLLQALKEHCRPEDWL